MRKHEFSKVIFWLVWSTNLLVILFCGVMIFWNYRKNGFVDFGVMNVLIPSTAAELASATGFYYWKTRTNNVYEYGEKFIMDLAQAMDAQSTVMIAQAFFNSAQMQSTKTK